MTSLSTSALLFLILIATSCGPAGKLPAQEMAIIEKLEPSDGVSYYDLPDQGKVQEEGKFWSGDFWPMKTGSINNRWNSVYPDGFTYYSPTKDELLMMTAETISTLSPAEKYDLLMGRYDYPLKTEVANLANPEAQEFEGLFNGWAAASYVHVEPAAKTLRNPDGLPIPFYTSDIKAILSYYYAYEYKENITVKIGRECELRNGWINTGVDCKNELDAGTFHVMMANKLGVSKKSFMIDVEQYNEKWNHPVIGYYAMNEGLDTVGEDAPLGSTVAIKIKTTITYVDISIINSMNPEPAVTKNIDYSYKLYLNSKNNVLGGKWISSERPKFVWMMNGAESFSGFYSGLNELLKN